MYFTHDSWGISDVTFQGLGQRKIHSLVKDRYVKIHCWYMTDPHHVCVIHQRYTSIHSSIHVPLCIKAAVVIHTNGQLGASCIDTHAQQPLGRGLRLVMYRCVSFSIEKRRYSRMYWILSTWRHQACKPIPDRYLTTYRLNTQRYKTSECLKYNGCIADKIHCRYNEKGENTYLGGVSDPFFGGKRALTRVMVHPEYAYSSALLWADLP